MDFYNTEGYENEINDYNLDYDDNDDYESLENEDVFYELFKKAKNINDYYEIINIESSIKIGKWTVLSYEKIVEILLKENNEKILDIIEKISNCLYNNEYIKNEFRNITEKLLFKCYKKSIEILLQKNDYIHLLNLIQHFCNFIKNIECEIALEYLNEIISTYEIKEFLEILLDYFKSNQLLFYHKYSIKKIKDSQYLTFDETNESIKEKNIRMLNQKYFVLEDKQIFILSIFFLQNSFLLINYYVKQKEHKVLMIAIINNNLSLVKNWYIGKEIFFFYEIKNNNVLIRKDKDFCILNINQKYEIKFEILFSIKLDYFDVILSKDNDIVIYNDFSIEIYLFTEKSTNYYQNMNKERKKRTDIYIHSLFVINSSNNKKIIISFQDKTKIPYQEKIQIINFYGLIVEKEISWEIPYYCESRLIQSNDKYFFFNCCDYTFLISISTLEIHDRIFGNFDFISDNYIFYSGKTKGLTKNNYQLFNELPKITENCYYKLLCNNGKIECFKLLNELNCLEIFHHKEDKFLIYKNSIYKLIEIYNN